MNVVFAELGGGGGGGGGGHWDLIISQVWVEEGYELMAHCCIYYMIDAWEEKGIFRVSVI